MSGDKTASLNINQDARIYAGRLIKGDEIIHNIIGKAYILISDGTISVSGNEAQKGDGLAISEEETVQLEALSDAELLIIEVPGKQNAR